MTKSIVVFGSGGHAKVVIDSLIFNREYKIVGVVTENETHIKRGEFYGIKVLGGDANLKKLAEEFEFNHGIIGIGDNSLREKVSAKVLSALSDFQFINAVHPSAQIAPSVRLGEGIAIMAGAVINADTKIDDHALVNTNASVDHDCHLHSFSSVAPGATLGGNVNLDTAVAIGLGASVIQNISIGARTVVGAGAVVVTDIETSVTVIGVPARPKP